MKRVYFVVALICMILTGEVFARTPISISVDPSVVTIGRTDGTGNFPHSVNIKMTITYDEGPQNVITASPDYLQNRDIILNSVYFWPGTGSYYRLPNVPDVTLICEWKYTAEGSTAPSVTSTIYVKGQIGNIHVEPITIGRTGGPLGKGYVIIERHYTDGFEDTFQVNSKSFLKSESPTGKIFFADGWNYFGRISNVSDEDITCVWEYVDGVPQQTTSSIHLLGQAERLEISSGEATKTSAFSPVKNIYYTDGTSDMNAPGNSINLLSISPSNLVVYAVGFWSFSRLTNAPNGIATCKWSFFDGVPVYATSTVTVTGGADSLVNQIPETAPNDSSQNKPNETCPTNNSGTSCGNSCGPQTKRSTGPTAPNVAHPIYINNLEFIEEETDLEIPGRGINYTFERSYRSRINFPSSLGWNWSQNYNMRFVPDPDDNTKVIFYNEESQADIYTIESSGDLTPPAYLFKKVVKESDGSLLLRNRNGFVCKFYPLNGSTQAGRLSAMISRCGNRLTFQYNSTGQISTVLDSLSRPINYYYNSDGRLSKIVDFAGREVNYTYSAAGDLVEVRTPAVTGTPNGNDFPNGKVTRYTYSTGYVQLELNHNLLTVTKPNEVASGGSPFVINYYDSDDRLITQVWGGTNASGIPAGGTITYARELVNQDIDPDNLELPREVVTIVDRNGNETVFSYNKNFNEIKREQKTRGVRPGDPASFVTTYKYSAIGLMKEKIQPLGNRVVYEYDENNPDPYMRGNLLSVTRYPDATRGGDQQFLKTSYQYEPVYNQVWKITEERGNDPAYVPQNGGSASAERYTTENVFDYMEGGLDTAGCLCGHTLRDMLEKFDIHLGTFESQLNRGDLNGDGQFNICGNPIMVKHPTVTLRTDSPQVAIEGGVQQVIEQRWSYNKYGQVAYTETPEGEVTMYFYYPESDPEGDGLDIRTGNNNAGQPFDTLTGGYLKETWIDHSHTARYRGTAQPAQVCTRIGYDVRGNRIWTMDGRGIRSDFTYNQLDQVVEATRASDISGSSEPGLTAYAYKSRRYYDYNNNVTRLEIEYRDGNNPDLPQWLETTYVYDILDQVIQSTQRVNSNETIVSQIRYDANQNVVQRITPVSVSGIQSGNKVLVTYDERDLVYQETKAPGTQEAATITHNYDLNSNKVQVIDAEDNNGDGQGDISTIEYDGFDRAVRTIDAVGNETKLKYDSSSNVTIREAWGLIGGSSRTSNSTSGNVLLARRYSAYDELSRVYQSASELFVPTGVTTTRPAILSEGDLDPGDGKVTGFTDYDRSSRVTFVTRPSPSSALRQSRSYYDGMSRVIRAIDADGNEALSEYDKNSNAVRVTVIEKHSTGRIAQESFTTLNVYDSLNRLVRTTDAAGQTRRFYYDSRDIAIRTTDAQGPLISDPLGLYAGNINSDGNLSEVLHDGLGRVLQTTRELRVDGQGGNPIDQTNPSNPDGKIIETKSWDQNSRLVSVCDDKGNVTSYQYDNRNRLIQTTFADGTTNVQAYDRDSNLIRFTDNNGSVSDNTFDAIGRITQRNVTRATAKGVKGTTLQAFQFDGLSRLTQATDNNDPDNLDDDSIVERKYDSFGRILEETQNTKVISANWTLEADPVDLSYPNSRKISYTFDNLSRLRSITNSGEVSALVSYDYIGSRVIERTYANGTRLTTLNDAGNTDEGYDSLGRLVKMRHLKGTDLIAGFGYGYNRENIKTYSEDLLNGNLSELYRNDSVYRLADFKRGTLNATKDGIQGSPTNTQAWQLDGVGNWATTTVDGQSKTQVTNNMNEYESFGGTAQTHDDNGNLSDDGSRILVYDFANRLLEVWQKGEQGANTLTGRYTYDSFNRRISKYFTRTKQEQGGEYQTDSNTLALYHFNEDTGPVLDSSGNNNNAPLPILIKRGVEGLWNTKAVEFKGVPVIVPNSQSLNNLTNKLTIETWVYLKAPECNDKKHKPFWKQYPCKRHPFFCPLCWKNWEDGSLINRPGMYQLQIDEQTKKAEFTLFIQETRPPRTRKLSISSNEAISLDDWVHLAGVYDGAKLILYVNGVKQTDEESASGNIKRLPIPLFLGGLGFRGRIEEGRISNIARTEFSGGSVESRETVLRTLYWNEWKLLEENEHTAPEGQQLGEERLTRQFIDGRGIDEHLVMDMYKQDGSGIEKTLYYHENARGDTVAMNDARGNVVLRLAYSAYGEVYRINENGQLEPFTDYGSVTYMFQGREIDEETGLYQFRYRFYNPVQGRFMSRDPIGYKDSMGLYEAFKSNPNSFIDSLGTEGIKEPPDLPGSPAGISIWNMMYCMTIYYTVIPRIPSFALKWRDEAIQVCRNRYNGILDTDECYKKYKINYAKIISIWLGKCMMNINIQGKPSIGSVISAHYDQWGYSDEIRGFFFGVCWCIYCDRHTHQWQVVKVP